MFYALATMEDSYMGDNLFGFSALAPCTIQVPEGPSTLYLPHGVFNFEEYGIYSLGGPHWLESKIKIKANFDQEVWDYARGYGGGEAVSVQTDMHWCQNCLANRFQEYAPNFNEGETEAALIPIETISIVPITMFSGNLDRTCGHHQAKITASIIGERVRKFVSPHNYHHWNWGQPLDDWVFDDLNESLRNPEWTSSEQLDSGISDE